jgi:hypothetical protein
MAYRQKEYKSQGYKLQKLPQRKYGVKEIATNQIVQTFGYITEAREGVRKYSLGSGFNGWTPEFILRKTTKAFVGDD